MTTATRTTIQLAAELEAAVDGFDRATEGSDEEYQAALGLLLVAVGLEAAARDYMHAVDGPTPREGDRAAERWNRALEAATALLQAHSPTTADSADTLAPGDRVLWLIAAYTECGDPLGILPGTVRAEVPLRYSGPDPADRWYEVQIEDTPWRVPVPRACRAADLVRLPTVPAPLHVEDRIRSK